MKDIYKFKPFFGLHNPHVQTLLSYVVYKCQEPLSKTHLLTLEDGDKIALDITTPENWKPTNPTILMMHGVGGSSKSPYLVRIATKLRDEGMQAVRLNYRGIGTGEGHAKSITHGGSSQDVYEVIQHLKKLFPSSPLTVIGFSLSGNMLLKLIGECSSLDGVEKAIAICPSVDLKDSSKRLEKWQNRIYQKSILDSIIQSIESTKSCFAYQPHKKVNTCKTLRDFDSLYTAPSAGFVDCDDYYEKSSSLSLVPNIQMPCKILFAKDDPLVDCGGMQELKLPKNIELLVTKHGGHMGFLNYPKNKNPFWMDSLLLHWIKTN